MPAIAAFNPLSGKVGARVTITGTDFIGVTGVALNGVDATYTVLSPTKIKTYVPVGATTGRITVTTPEGTGSSATDFTVG